MYNQDLVNIGLLFAMLLAYKTVFKKRSMTRDKGVHFIMLKGLTQKDAKVLYLHTLNGVTQINAICHINRIEQKNIYDYVNR